jgi:hypothetical protein
MNVALSILAGWLVGSVVVGLLPHFLTVAREKISAWRYVALERVRQWRSPRRDVWCPTCKFTFRKRAGWLVRHIARCRGAGRKGARQW